MQEGLPPTTAPACDRARDGKMSLRRDQRGIGILPIIIIAILGIFGISLFSAINWRFLLALMVVVVMGLAVVGGVFFKIPFKYVVMVSVLCLGVVIFIEVTAPVILGLLLVGFAMWKFTPEKHLAIMVALIGFGCLLVVWGTAALESLGIVP